MLEKGIQLTVKFRYLSIEDMKEIERQIEKFNSDNYWGVEDIIEFATDRDCDSSLVEPEIKDNNIFIDIYRPMEDDFQSVNLIKLPLKDEEHKRDIAKEVYSYVLYLILQTSELINFLKYCGTFSIKNIDRVSNIQ